MKWSAGLKFNSHWSPWEAKKSFASGRLPLNIWKPLLWMILDICSSSLIVLFIIIIITKIFPKPSLRSNKLSNIWIKSLLGWWSVQITVIPCFVSWRKSLITWWARYESRPVVGSSRKIIAGLTTIPHATAKRFFSPPEILFLLSAFPMS